MAKKEISKEDVLKKINSYVKKKKYTLPYSVREEIAERIVKEGLTDKIEVFAMSRRFVRVRRADGTLHYGRMNDDSVALPRWCEKILDAFMSVEPCPVVVGGEIVPRLERPSPWWFSLRLEKRSWGDSAGFLTSPSAHFGFSGSNMAFSRKILEEFGGFNPDFGMNAGRVWLGEEPELFMRIYPDHPYFWYDPEIRVRHYVAASQLRLSGRLYRAFQTGRARRALERSTVSFQSSG